MCAAGTLDEAGVPERAEDLFQEPERNTLPIRNRPGLDGSFAVGKRQIKDRHNAVFSLG
jgi:hypothetical protein